MSEHLPRITCSQLVQVLKRAGFEEQRQKGSHVTLKRYSDGRRTTVPIHKGHEVPIGTLKAILRDANISNEQLRELLK